MLETNYHGEQIDILCNSQSALQAISSLEKKLPMVLAYIKMLNRVASENNILQACIPRHGGINGKEIAGLLVKKAATTSSIGLKLFFAVGSHTLRE